MNNMDFDKLVEDALKADFEGWNFCYLDNRWFADDLPWRFHDYLQTAMVETKSLLDIGTGGGEFLASLAPLPASTFATEGYPPNVRIAAERLTQFGVQVVDTSADPKNYHLPFQNKSFDMIMDRHAGANASELYRCLSEAGSYITEQVGDQDGRMLAEWFGVDSTDKPEFNREVLSQELEQAGFSLVDAQEAFPSCTYKDIGAVVYYLRAIPWLVPDFDTTKYHTELLSLHEHICQHGGFCIKRHRFFIHARKDSRG